MSLGLRRLAPRFVDWRLSRIDEEVDRLSCSSDVTTPPSPPLPPPPPHLLDDDDNDPADSESSEAPQRGCSADETPPAAPVVTPCRDDPASSIVYSNEHEWRKQQLDRSAADDEREALRFIKEKYDSLGKISVDRPTCDFQASAAPHSAHPVDEPAGAVYENVPRRSAQVDAVAESRKVSVECAECQAEKAMSNCAAHDPCCVSKQTTARYRQLKQHQREHPPCQCHQHPHQQQQQQQQQPQQQEAEMQRQRLVDECTPRSPLTDGELIQIDLFYRSYKTTVFVCTCMATLSFSRPVLTAPAKSRSNPKPTAADDYDDGVWACVRTGIPVIVRDNVDGRRRRRIYVLLAERGTGFELWRAPLDRLSDYAVTAAAISAECGPSAAVICSQHTMRLSVDDTMSVTARLVFDDQAAADEFHRQLVRLATAADDDATAAKAGSGRTKKKRGQKGVASISKADISQPCCFSHVTRLERGVSCRGRPGLHIVVASGRQTSPVTDAPADATTPPRPPTSSSSRTAKHCSHSSFKANRI